MKRLILAAALAACFAPAVNAELSPAEAKQIDTLLDGWKRQAELLQAIPKEKRFEYAVEVPCKKEIERWARKIDIAEDGTREQLQSACRTGAIEKLNDWHNGTDSVEKSKERMDTTIDAMKQNNAAKEDIAAGHVLQSMYQKGNEFGLVLGLSEKIK